MRLNENTKIIGKKVILIPYEAKHVAIYHNWMQSAELRELTASEPLSLDEEYAMQRSWREDEDKCTFLILDRAKYESTREESSALIGDTNLFVRNNDEDGNTKIAEAEIMIAEESERCKGFGSEAMLLMFKYAIMNLNVKQFEEITLQRVVSDKWLQWLDSQVQLDLTEYY